MKRDDYEKKAPFKEGGALLMNKKSR